MQILKVVAAALSIACLAAPLASHAQTIDASGRGWYRVSEADGALVAQIGSPSYLVGRGIVVSGNPAIRGEYRNYFAFDLSAYAGQTFGSAELSLYNPKYGDLNTTTNNPNSYGGFAQSNTAGLDAGVQPRWETFDLHQVTTPSANILNGGAGQQGFADLGDGPVFGSYTASLADNGSFIRIALNADGLAALNSAVGGTFILGGSLSTINICSTCGSQTVFGFSNDPSLALTQLSLAPVPEPETYAMMLLGLSLVGTIARRRTRKV